jgi:transcriptional regulator with XRE-family HTH domain
MTFTEKLKKCGQDVNKAKAGETAGLGPTTISNYIAKGSIPRADIALKIARALDVPFEWLIDPDQSWPPPAKSKSERSLTDVPYTELGRELGRRYRLELLDVLAALDHANREDWSSAIEAVRSLKPDHPIPPRAARLMAQLQRIIEQTLTVTLRYDVRLVADFLHDQLPGRDRPIEEMTYTAVLTRFFHIQQSKGLLPLIDWMNEHPEQLRAAGLFSGRCLTVVEILELIDEKKRGELLRKTVEAKA